MVRKLKSSFRNTSSQFSNAATELLNWYDQNRRNLPWRSLPGEEPDLYRVWLSEIMLQQTTVASVVPYFEKFLTRWPSIQKLAAADLNDVLHCWQGLGYYARARNLHRCARTIVGEHGAVFPSTEEALLRLPGIGRYTAAAMVAIGFNRKAVVVDGNVERVMARLYAVDDPLPQIKPRLRECAAGLTPGHRAGDYAQAVMDLGATICTPRRPKCDICPWQSRCVGKKHADDLPRRSITKNRPIRRAIAYCITNSNGSILLRRRSETGLLGGMVEVPSSAWLEASVPDKKVAKLHSPLALASSRMLPGIVRHTFTHFHLELLVLAGRARQESISEGFWCPLEKLEDHALPTLMKKIIDHAKKYA